MEVVSVEIRSGGVKKTWHLWSVTHGGKKERVAIKVIFDLIGDLYQTEGTTLLPFETTKQFWKDSFRETTNKDRLFSSNYKL